MSAGSGKSSNNVNEVGTSSNTGTGSSTQTNTSPFGQQLGWSGTSLGQQVQPALTDLLTSYQNLLTKGQISGAGIPMAQAAISQARGAASANLGSAENFLARSGGANSPFGSQLLSSIAAQGNEAIAQAPVSIYEQMFAGLPGFISGTEGQSLNAIGQAGALNNTTTGSSSFTSSGRTTNVGQGSGSSFNLGGNFSDLGNLIGGFGGSGGGGSSGGSGGFSF